MLKTLTDILNRFPPRQRETLVTHPNNRSFLEVFSEQTGKFEPVAGVTGLDIVFDKSIEERDIELKWYPPPPEKFVEYGPEDEHWMRPLGLGRIERVDRGPKFMSMQVPVTLVDLEVPDFDDEAMAKLVMQYRVEDFYKPVVAPFLMTGFA